MSFSWETYHSLLWSAIAIAFAVLAGVLLHHLLSRFAQRVAHRPGAAQEHVLISHIARPVGAVLPILLLLAVVPGLPLSPRGADPAHHLLLLFLIAAVAWLGVGFIGLL